MHSYAIPKDCLSGCLISLRRALDAQITRTKNEGVAAVAGIYKMSSYPEILVWRRLNERPVQYVRMVMKEGVVDVFVEADSDGPMERICRQYSTFSWRAYSSLPLAR